MLCPKCRSEFEALDFQQVNVDRCTGCGGLWLDALEKEALEELSGSARIDTGKAGVGRELNKMSDVSCPKCDVAMLRMADERQPHVEYEMCPTCYGTYFDAGEFRDLSEFTFMERLRNIVDTLLAVR